MMTLEIINRAEVMETDLEYILKVDLIILIWMLRMRKEKRGRRKRREGKGREGRERKGAEGEGREIGKA